MNSTIKDGRAGGRTKDGFEEGLSGRYCWRKGNQEEENGKQDLRTNDLKEEKKLLGDE